MIPAFDAIKTINKYRQESLVVPIMTPNRYWELISGRPELDLPVIGGMGKASSIALGLALARPDKRVLVLDGDGSLLMNLGTLVTIGAQQPKNLVHFVFEDGVYFTTGGQPVPGSGAFSFADMARAAGYKESHQFDNMEDFVSELPRLLDVEGPVFICLKVVNDSDAPTVHLSSTRDAIKRMRVAIRKE